MQYSSGQEIRQNSFRKAWAPRVSVPHGILQELRQDVVERHGDEWEAGRHMAIDAHTWGVAILVLTQTSAGGGGKT